MAQHNNVSRKVKQSKHYQLRVSCRSLSRSSLGAAHPVGRPHLFWSAALPSGRWHQLAQLLLVHFAHCIARQRLHHHQPAWAVL